MPDKRSITLITPVWNNAETIGDNIRSVKQQTVSCQQIFVDGASNDGTVEIIEKERASDSILISEPDDGMYDAINKGLALADGDIIGILNSDDYYPGTEVLAQVQRVFASGDIAACYGDLLYVDRLNTSKVVRTWRSGTYDPNRFYNGWMPPHPAFFLRKACYEQFGGYRLDLGSAADYELMLRMLFKHRLSARHIPAVLVHMRNQGMSNASLKNRIKAHQNDRRAWILNNMKPKPWTLLAKPLSKLGQWI